MNLIRKLFGIFRTDIPYMINSFKITKDFLQMIQCLDHEFVEQALSIEIQSEHCICEAQSTVQVVSDLEYILVKFIFLRLKVFEI
jgi:nitrate reductase cytochrome c-type subunit